MREYIDEAIILNKRESGYQDVRYSIFTKRFGKMWAKATSARKVMSKLAGHLEPGSLAEVRLIEQHGLRVVDALRSRMVFGSSPTHFILHDLSLLDRLLAEAEPESRIWALAARGTIVWPEILAVLGWDPSDAICSVCGVAPVAGFSVLRQEFFCARCAGRLSRAEMVILGRRS